MNVFGCKHKFGKIEDGYQYCEKCGKAAIAPTTECNHQWETKQEITKSMYPGHNLTVAYIVRCTKCGTNERQNVDQ